MYLRLLPFAAFLLAAPVSESDFDRNQPLSCSLIQLLANPERYDGKRVRVDGFLHHEFEDVALYMHKDDADYLIRENAVWLSFDKAVRVRPALRAPKKESNLVASDLRGEYVKVEGLFEMKDPSDRDACAGTIRNTSTIMQLTRFYDGKTPLFKP